MVILATCSGRAPAAARARPRLPNTWRAWTARSPAPTRLPSASSGSWPATNTSLLPVATATWLYVGGVGRSSGLMSSSVIDGMVSPAPVGGDCGLEHSLRVVFLLHVPHALEVAAPVGAVFVD